MFGLSYLVGFDSFRCSFALGTGFLNVDVVHPTFLEEGDEYTLSTLGLTAMMLKSLRSF
jgi:hypothetical protein